ncbi:MAG: HNH endonuclease [Rhizonema sp. PD37]|nr:HNH endonuclease [Rhizonema sp. PD37]
MTPKNLDYYINKFANLHVSRSAGIAPNKPILLLSVIEAIALRQVQKNQIPLNAELIATFLNLWSHLETVRKPDIGLPFFHLRSDGFWHLQLKPGLESLIDSKVKLRTVNAIRQTVEYAYLDQELWDILQYPQQRSILTQVLIDSRFAGKTLEIEQLLQINAFAELQKNLQSLGGKVYQPEELQDEQTKIVRDAAFRKIIVTTYNQRCTFCGLQILDSKTQNIVDGAHIKPFSQFYDDRIDNGLSLCKNHHWAFDRGWFSINDDYTIRVASDLREDSPHAKPMREFSGMSIILPTQKHYYPRLEAIRWHQEHMFEAIA